MDSGKIQILSVSGDKIPGLDINAVSLNVCTTPHKGYPMSLHMSSGVICLVSDLCTPVCSQHTSPIVSLCIDEEGEHIASCAQDGKVSGTIDFLLLLLLTITVTLTLTLTLSSLPFWGASILLHCVHLSILRSSSVDYLVHRTILFSIWAKVYRLV